MKQENEIDDAEIQYIKDSDLTPEELADFLDLDLSIILWYLREDNV